MDLNYSAGSQDSSYKQVFASLKNEIEVIVVFLTKLKYEDEGRTIQYVASLNGTMDKDVKDAIKSAQTIIEKFEHLDEVNASSRNSQGCEEDFPTDQTFRNMRSSYITQVEEVLKVVHSVGGLERQRVVAEDSSTDWSDTLSDTDSMSDMRKRLDALRMVDSLAEAQIQRVDAAEVSVIQLQGVPKRFTFDELFMATRGFSEKLGDGGFGTVYRGMLPGCIPVAVKRMNTVVSIHGQGIKEFKSEVSVISQLRHRNLVELRGWCEDAGKQEYMLVFDLMPNGSLDKLMFHLAKSTDPVELGGAQGRTEGKSCLSLAQRLKILSTTADALDYLHQGWKHQVIHGDIKCANILLDKELNAKLTDFGLSRLVDHDGEAYTVHVGGTRGYSAPEVCTEGKYTDKSDVYAFGVVLFEVVCGRRNWPGNAHEKTLVEWVKERLSKGDVISTMDKELRGCDMQQEEQVETLLMIGVACCDIDYRKRPSMTLVVKMLAGERRAKLRRMMMSLLKDKGDSARVQQTTRLSEDFGDILARNPTDSSVEAASGISRVLHLSTEGEETSNSKHSGSSAPSFMGPMERPTQLVNVNSSDMKTRGEPFGAPFVKLGRRAFQEQSPMVQLEGTIVKFSYKQLSAVTGDFSRQSLIRRGGLGNTYLGVLPYGIRVTVQRLNCYSIWEPRVSLQRQLEHRNVVKLLGWCDGSPKLEESPCLVHEFMPNGSLKNLLFNPVEGKAPSWSRRLKILKGTAAGLDYLHSGCKQQVIHRDVTCANIMLDEEHKAKLGNFGIARGVPRGIELEEPEIVGTFGYVDPQYSSNHKLSSKADVYAFGVVVLEVVCAQPSLDFNRDPVSIVEWVWQKLEDGNPLKAVDRRLEDCDTYWVLNVLKIGLLCSLINSEARPSMGQVVQMLAGNIRVPPLPPSKNRDTPSADLLALARVKVAVEYGVKHNLGTRSRALSYPLKTMLEGPVWALAAERGL